MEKAASWRPMIMAVLTSLSVGLGVGTQVHTQPVGPFQTNSELAKISAKLDRLEATHRSLIRALIVYQLETDRYISTICYPGCPEKPTELEEAAAEMRRQLLK